MSKKKKHIHINDDYQESTLKSLQDQNLFEADPEKNPVLMRYIATDSGWAAVELGVLEKGASSPRKFAKFAKFLDEHWQTNGTVNGGNLRAAVHLSAFRRKQNYEESVGWLPAPMQANLVKLNTSLRQTLERYFTAAAAEARALSEKLDASLPQQQKQRAKDAEKAAISEFTKANPSDDIAAVAKLAQAAVRVNLVIEAMRFKGPPKRLLTKKPTDSTTLTIVVPPSDEAISETSDACTQTNEPKPQENAGSAKTRQNPSVAPARTKIESKLDEKPAVAGRDSNGTEIDVPKMLLGGKIVELTWKGQPGYVIPGKIPTEHNDAVRELGLKLVDYEAHQRFWGPDVAAVAKAVSVAVVGQY